MNQNLAYNPGDSIWRPQTFTRISRSVRGNVTLYGQVDEEVFRFTIAAGSSLIGVRAMLKFHFCMHNCNWGEVRNYYVSAVGPITGLPGNGGAVGTRMCMAEYTPNSQGFPGGDSGRRGHLNGALGINITGPGTISVRANLEQSGGEWLLFDTNTEMSTCALIPISG